MVISGILFSFSRPAREGYIAFPFFPLLKARHVLESSVVVQSSKCTHLPKLHLPAHDSTGRAFLASFSAARQAGQRIVQPMPSFFVLCKTVYASSGPGNSRQIKVMPQFTVPENSQNLPGSMAHVFSPASISIRILRFTFPLLQPREGGYCSYNLLGKFKSSLLTLFGQFKAQESYQLPMHLHDVPQRGVLLPQAGEDGIGMLR
jgi:hypothetical protein